MYFRMVKLYWQIIVIWIGLLLLLLLLLVISVCDVDNDDDNDNDEDILFEIKVNDDGWLFIAAVIEVDGLNITRYLYF